LRVHNPQSSPLSDPYAPSAAVNGSTNLHKIKLRQLGYRMVHSGSDTNVTVAVITAGKRDRNEVYDLAPSRKKDD